MAKIKATKLEKIPDEVVLGHETQTITVIVELEFHRLDIQFKMQYYVHLFIYDVHGKNELPVIMSNWDDSCMISVSTIAGRSDDYLGKGMAPITAESSYMKIKVPIDIHLGEINPDGAYISRKVEVLATMAPVFARASKWSEPQEVELLR